MDEKWWTGDFITFQDVGYVSVGAATRKYILTNKTIGSIIGIVKWNNAWRRYCLSPGENSVFDAKCLREVAEFCDIQTEHHKQDWK